MAVDDNINFLKCGKKDVTLKITNADGTGGDQDPTEPPENPPKDNPPPSGDDIKNDLGLNCKVTREKEFENAVTVTMEINQEKHTDICSGNKVEFW
ncbi:MAG: hypothetical protein WC422_02350 [Candidatus Paceibacterota bacterium]|jgi:hypothetical protein